MPVICFFQGRTKEEGWTTTIHESEDSLEADENRKEDLVDMDSFLKLLRSLEWFWSFVEPLDQSGLVPNQDGLNTYMPSYTESFCVVYSYSLSYRIFTDDLYSD